MESLNEILNSPLTEVVNATFYMFADIEMGSVGIHKCTVYNAIQENLAEGKSFAEYATQCTRSKTLAEILDNFGIPKRQQYCLAASLTLDLLEKQNKKFLFAVVDKINDYAVTVAMTTDDFIANETDPCPTFTGDNAQYNPLSVNDYGKAAAYTDTIYKVTYRADLETLEVGDIICMQD